ncbi:hypothetical protein Chor_011353 [Crotalus horridus]
MDIERLQEALKDFEKRGKKEVCPILDQFLCHVAKTGETMIQWSQFKGYFIFKLEKVMDDFRTSAPEPRGPPNPNVEYIPFEEMKERILKIVTGFNGVPFTIQRLCELLTDPRRNYTGTDKFLRGVEKNVMVVSCVYPSSEKNNSNSLNRMNGVMFPGNSPGYSDSESPASEPERVQNCPVKNKHPGDDPSEMEGYEVKRLKFDEEEEAEETSNESGPHEACSAMVEETETTSPSQDKEKETTEERQHCKEEVEEEEESLMMSREVFPERKVLDKDSASSVEKEDVSEENNQIGESDQTQAMKDSSSPNSENSGSFSSKADCSDKEELGSNVSETPEIESETPVENSDDATEAADEPMEQD